MEVCVERMRRVEEERHITMRQRSAGSSLFPTSGFWLLSVRRTDVSSTAILSLLFHDSITTGECERFGVTANLRKSFMVTKTTTIRLMLVRRRRARMKYKYKDR